MDSDGRVHEGFRLHLSQFYLGATQILQCRSRIRQPLEENLQRPEGFSTRQTKRAKFSTSKKVPSKEMSSLLFNTVLQYSLKDEIQRWQKKKRMGIYLSDQDRDCLTNLRFADDVMLFATLQRTAAEYDVRIQESNRESGTEDPPRQDEDSQQPEHHEFEYKKTLKSVK